MNKIHAGLEQKEFFDTTPPNIVKRTICIDSGKIATDLCKKDPRGSRVVEEYFIEGTEPAYSDTCKVHISVKVCTESQDAWGRDLLANEYCPEHSVKEIVGIKRPVQYTPQFPDDRYPEDHKYEIPEGEYCVVHDAGVLIPPVNEENPDNPSDDWNNWFPPGHNHPGNDFIEDIGDPISEENYDE